jgi:hypothetical protein
MRTPVLLATALLAVVATASPATAAKPDRFETPEPSPKLELCGTQIVISVIKNNVKVNFEAGESGFTDFLRGNFVFKLTAEDGRSAVVRSPGRLFATGTEDGTVIVESIGRTLLVGDNPVTAKAQLEAGLPNVALITGRTVSTVTLGADMKPSAIDITYTGNVTDVCDLLE